MPRKKAKQVNHSTLHNYFAHATTGSSELEVVDVPGVATDVRSTYLLLHAKRHAHEEEEACQIVKHTLSVLRGNVHKERLKQLTSEPQKARKTICQCFKEQDFGTTSFFHSGAEGAAVGAGRIKVDTSLAWKLYYTKLLVMAQARQWLSAAERLDPIPDSPVTPKTLFQLADAIKRSHNEYLPFGKDFEDIGATPPS